MRTSSKVPGRRNLPWLALLISVGLASACGNSSHSSGSNGSQGGSGSKGSGGGNSDPATSNTGNGTPGDGGSSNSKAGAGAGGNAGSPAGGANSSTTPPHVCADTEPPGSGIPCSSWKSWGECGSQWFVNNYLCEVTCGVCTIGTTVPGGGSNGGSGNGGGGSGSGNGGGGGGSGGAGAGGKGGASTSSSGGTSAVVPKTSTPFVPPADAKPTPETSGVNGAFRVNGQGHLTHNGAEFQVRGGNWFGLEGQDDVQRPGAMELYIGSVYWADASHKRTMEQTMKEITAAPLSLNTIRVPIAPQTLVAGHKDGLYSRTDVKIRNNDPELYPYTDALSALEDFLVQLDKNNLYVILDMHSCSNHIGWRAGKIDDGPPWTDANRENYKYKKEDYTCKTGEDAYDRAKWLADIHTMAKLPKKLGIKNIIGIDCFNEPFKYSWSDWADLSKECYDAIAAEDDDLIAVIEGISGSHEDASGKLVDEPYGDVATNPNWGENLYGQQFDPIQIPKDRLCFSPHTYGPAVYVQRQFIEQTPECAWLEDDAAGKAKCKLVVERKNADVVAALRKGWDERFGYLHDKGYCVIIGEFGGHTGWPFNNPVKPQAATVWAHLPKDVRYDWEWQNIFVDYLNAKKMTDFLYWSVNPESGDTGGLYNHLYTLSNESGWGQWNGLDTEKAGMLGNLK
jgi:endoglucanase